MKEGVALGEHVETSGSQSLGDLADEEEEEEPGEEDSDEMKV